MWLGRVAAMATIAILVALGGKALADVVLPPPEVVTVSADKVCSTSATLLVLPFPQRVAASGVLGTSTEDLQGFANRFNEVRIANCLPPVPTDNFRRSSCVEQRLIWIAEDPSDDPQSAWGHDGTQRSDGEPPVGCDANLAGGPGDTGAEAAEKWWFSAPHRESLYRPDYGGPITNVCIDFAMTHGGLPDESRSFARAGAAWADCELYRDQAERTRM